MSLEDILEEYEERVSYHSDDGGNEEGEVRFGDFDDEQEQDAIGVNDNPNEGGGDGPVNGDATSTDPTPVVKKRVIRNPRVKLDADRICGKRGIPELLKEFENVKFDWKKNEKMCLKKMMTVLEHWAHRLMPRLTFDDCLTELEKLGSKKPVQVYIKKVRLDMPLLSDDHLLHEDVVENLSESAQQTVSSEPDQDETVEDVFEKLIRGENLSNNEPYSSLPSSPVISLEKETTSASVYPQSSVPELNSEHMGFTKEQLERIEANRKRAEEFRKAKAKVLNNMEETCNNSNLDTETMISIEGENS